MVKWRRLGWAWDHLARHNALGAILTRDGAIADWNSLEFFATGRADVDRFMASLLAIAPGVAQTRALDFGCGVGRVTRALAAHFGEVVGVDVSPSMVRRARDLNTDCAGCRFVVNRRPHLRRFAAASFPVVYSRLVLQHVRPALVRRYIPELVRVLAPGGVLMFQLPDHIAVEPQEAFERAPVLGHSVKRMLPMRLVIAYRRVKYRFVARDRTPRMDMFGMPRDEVIALIARGGGRVLEILPDESHGRGAPGYEYWVTR